jgi:photosystem II stability/assembly factor-like uncharacterized protein
MNKSILRRSLLALLLGASFANHNAYPAALPWQPVGPDGGDARAFASDPGNPKHLYLGTTSSWIYQSTDGGSTWKRLAKLGATDDMVVDNILVDTHDPKTLMAGVWRMDRPDGAIYVSHDSGLTWTRIPGMDGQSVRALAQAPSDRKVWVAGTLKGIYRSEDGGTQWNQISPTGSGEIREVESIAIDPADAHTIYAGTWHLPWKTTDGGANWRNIKQGLIDDSDVFSIIIDPSMPSVVYASACSGIYRSDTAGEQFRKVQGIPTTARRTRVLMQDPVTRNTVYAGTTEGLYKTLDGGTNWTRETGPDVIINDVYVDPTNAQHVLLATDRSGVLRSEDAGATFQAANSGFSQRQVATLLTDVKNPQTLYAGVLNDKGYGGVFISEDAGATWQQRSQGLDGRDVFSLAQSTDGTLLAGTSHGIFHWTGNAWEPDGKVVHMTEKTTYVMRKGKKVKKTVSIADPPRTIESRVNEVDVNGATWYAATSDGLYVSATQGASWEPSGTAHTDYGFVDASGKVAFAAQRAALVLSEDNGKNWQTLTLPSKLSGIRALATTPNGDLWLGGREGVFVSQDRGQTWQPFSALPISDISGLSYDLPMKRLVVTSRTSTLIFAIDPVEKNWKWWDSGWNLHGARSQGGRLIGASLADGVLMQSKQDGMQAEPVASARGQQ